MEERGCTPQCEEGCAPVYGKRGGGGVRRTLKEVRCSAAGSPQSAEEAYALYHNH